MHDDLDRLRASAELRQLLAHYSSAAEPDREVWQDRRMELEGADARELTKLHGELIASGWVEQNTGYSGGAQAGKVAGCYRATSAGIRALKVAERGQAQEEERRAA